MSARGSVKHKLSNKLVSRLLIQKKAVVIGLNRTRYNPKWEENRKRANPLPLTALPPIKNGRSVTISDIITLPLRDDERPVQYELVSTVEHNGSTLSGHYVSHLKHEGEFYLCNDNRPMEKSSSSTFDVTKSTIFLYKKIDSKETGSA